MVKKYTTYTTHFRIWSRWFGKKKKFRTHLFFLEILPSNTWHENSFWRPYWKPQYRVYIPWLFMLHVFQMSDSFAECQDYIQNQQQEIMRLKLQHTLELKVCFVLRIPFSCANNDYYHYYHRDQQYNTALCIMSRRARTYDPQMLGLVSKDKTYKLQTTFTDRQSPALHLQHKCPFKLTLPARWRQKPLQLHLLKWTTISIFWSVFSLFGLFLCSVNH